MAIPFRETIDHGYSLRGRMSISSGKSIGSEAATAGLAGF